MIVKSLSRCSGSTGQLVNYIFRYILEKEQAEKQEKGSKSHVFSKEDLAFYHEAFMAGQLKLEEQPDLAIPAEKLLAEQELNSAIRIPKTTAIAKELALRLKADNTDLKKTSLHLSSGYLITKNKDGERFYPLSLSTLFSKAKAERSTKDPPFIIRHNLRSRSIKGYVREFEKNEAMRLTRRSNSVTVFHHILSFSSQDKEQVTDAMLKDMAAKFIALRAPDCLYVGTKHVDHDHIHLHLAMSAVDLAGRSVRISKSKFQEIKKDLDRYQKEHYPELVHSLPEHGKKERLKHSELLVEKIKTHRPLEAEKLSRMLASVYATSTSVEHFLSSLKEHGYDPYYRSGTLTGVAAGKLGFRFSKLGYSQEKIKSLDLLKEQEEKELAELQLLRQSKERTTMELRLASLSERKSEPALESEVAAEIEERDASSESESKNVGAKNDVAASKEMDEKEIDEADNTEENDSRSR